MASSRFPKANPKEDPKEDLDLKAEAVQGLEIQSDHRENDRHAAATMQGVVAPDGIHTTRQTRAPKFSKSC